jgi:hypothetical protein
VFSASTGDNDGNTFGRKLNAHVRVQVQQNKWGKCKDVMFGVSNGGDVVVTYNISTVDEAESFKGIVVYEFEVELYREVKSLLSLKF